MLIGSHFLDLNYFEDSSGSPDMPVAILPKSGNVTLLQMDSKMNIDTFEEVRVSGEPDEMIRVMFEWCIYFLGFIMCHSRLSKDLRNIVSCCQGKDSIIIE